MREDKYCDLVSKIYEAIKKKIPIFDIVKREMNEAVAEEREACALVAEHLNGWGGKPEPLLAEHIAKVIRERK